MWKEYYRGRIWIRIEFFKNFFFGKFYVLKVYRLIVNLGKKELSFWWEIYLCF